MRRSSTEVSGSGSFDVGGENALDRPVVFIDRLRSGDVEHGVAVEQCDLHEYRPGFFRTAPAHRTEHAFGLAAPQISRHPYAGFQSHGIDDRPAAKSNLVDRVTDHRDQLAHQAIGHLSGHRHVAVALEFLDCGFGV